VRPATRTARVGPVLLAMALAGWASGCTREQRVEPAPEETAPGSPVADAPAGDAPGPGEPESATEGAAEADAGRPAEGPPEGFEPRGPAEVSEPWLAPPEAWRDLVSHLILLRADARRAGSPLLVTFQPDAVHVTGRDGHRRTLKLPEGLRLTGVPVHLLLASDLGLRAWGPDGTEIPLAEEVTLVRGVVSETGSDVSEFRLLVKGGQTFRSIP